ncbi:MAG: penicillin-binding transpeptidase domain-containing protein [Actinomycetota bacterium]|nr:penicillin-binding transpeptidase domain-containing protein [Actinomycetota bacterium]
MNARLVAGASVLALIIAGGTACTSGPQAEDAVAGFLRSWSAGDLAGAAKRTDNPAAAKADLQAAAAALGARSISARKGKTTVKDKAATAGFRARWTIAGLEQPWTYDGTLALVRANKEWLIHWAPTDIHPKLGAGQALSLHRTLPERAPILDGAGQPLFTRSDVVTVGIEPQKVKDLPRLAGTLAAALHVDAAPIIADVTKAKPTEFVPVATLRAADYALVRDQIHDLPGTVFQTGQKVLPPSPRFAQPLLGRVGDVTAEVLKEAGSSYRTGDQLGLSGLQRALNKELTGTATGEITVVDAKKQRSAFLATIPGRPGRAVRVTLDRRMQDAADAALSAVGQPAAIVALRPSTGAILAVANSALAPFDIALAGQYPAGSTFKIITASAALAGGIVMPTSTVACPATVTIGGRTIPNEGRFVLGQIPLRKAFARSCNTTFAALGDKIAPDAFQRTAALYGIGAAWRLPVTSFSGSVVMPSGDVERAADAIGQGKVLVSPLAEALMAATVQRGVLPAPSLLAGQPATATNPPSGVLPAAVQAALREFTRAVVTEGTATLLAGVPGGPVAGKTGTAEFGSAPPRAHSWFAGYQGDLAFAVFVYGGQTGGTLANPIAKDFLTLLQR